jgi:carboxypeptidase Taq
MPAAVAELVEELRRVSRIGSALALLGWDQETHLPSGGAGPRAEVLGALTEIAHERATSDRLGERIAAAAGAIDGAKGPLAALVRESKRDWERSRRVPTELAQEVAVASSRSMMAWRAARKADDFERFRPHLERMVGLKRRVAEALRGSTEKSRYDALLDEYEPGMTAARFRELVDAVKPGLVALVAEAAPRSAKIRTDFLSAGYGAQRQIEFAREILAAMGYDFERGRLDLTAHPFCSGIASPHDVRITTRVDEKDFSSNLFSVIHEGGHALYEQGLAAEWQGTPLGSATSHGIHESQSRLWENIIARSDPFWRHWLPRFRAAFPGRVDDVRHEEFVAAVNRVVPSLIRTEADEVTYSLHVMLRFELEWGLIEGEIAVRDLPGLWKDSMQALLGLVPPSDANGVLQDIHWSIGAFGYFPTYFLGNLYGAQLERAARRALPDLDAQLARGEMLPLREWLRREVHARGRELPAHELCRAVTGGELDPSHFLRYLEGKVARFFPA